MFSWDKSETTPVIIFAIDEPDGIPAPTQHGWFQSWVKDRLLPMKPLSGCWNGKKELSYLMFADMEPRLWQTWCKHQESILWLSGKVPGQGRQASLHYQDGRPPEFIGQWKPVARAECKEGDSWTYDGRSGLYWKAK